MVDSFSAGSTTRDTASRELGGLGGGDGGGFGGLIGGGSFSFGRTPRLAATPEQQAAVAKATADADFARQLAQFQSTFAGGFQAVPPPPPGGEGGDPSLSFIQQFLKALQPSTPGFVQGPESQNIPGGDGAGGTQPGGGAGTTLPGGGAPGGTPAPPPFTSSPEFLDMVAQIRARREESLAQASQAPGQALPPLQLQPPPPTAPPFAPFPALAAPAAPQLDLGQLIAGGGAAPSALPTLPAPPAPVPASVPPAPAPVSTQPTVPPALAPQPIPLIDQVIPPPAFDPQPIVLPQPQPTGGALIDQVMPPPNFAPLPIGLPGNSEAGTDPRLAASIAERARVARLTSAPQPVLSGDQVLGSVPVGNIQPFPVPQASTESPLALFKRLLMGRT